MWYYALLSPVITRPKITWYWMQSSNDQCKPHSALSSQWTPYLYAMTLPALCKGNSPVNGAWMFSLICAWINFWVNNREASDFRYRRVHYDAFVMILELVCSGMHVHRDNIIYSHLHMSRYLWISWLNLYTSYCTRYQQCVVCPL